MSDATAEAVGADGDRVPPPVAVAATADSVGHTVGGNTLEVAVPDAEGRVLESELSLAPSDGSEDGEAAAVPLGAPVGSPLPLPSGLVEGCAVALTAALGGCDAVAAPLAAPLSLLWGVPESAGVPLFVATRDAVAFVLPVPQGVVDGDPEAAPLLVAFPVGAPLAEDPGEALSELVGAGEEEPLALAEGEALGGRVEVPLSEAAPLPLGAVALAEGEACALPLPAALPLKSGLSVF